ncbi:MAG: galactose-1-phosphate uridylyltransferase, partial [Acidobacteria bacterium]
MANYSEQPHRRYNPLTEEWVLCSPQRTQRPWQGQVETSAPENLPAYDPQCYLCPGNARAGGANNPSYSSTFVFSNDFAALTLEMNSWEVNEDGLIVAHAETGTCRVICFSPRHDLSIPQMERSAIRHVVDAWAEETESLASHNSIGYVQVFENKGAMMGCS